MVSLLNNAKRLGEKYTMNMNYRKQYLYASAIVGAVLVALTLLLVLLPGSGDGTIPTEPPQMINPTDAPTEMPTAVPTDEPTEPTPQKTQNHATRSEATRLVFHPPALHEARNAISRYFSHRQQNMLYLQ